MNRLAAITGMTLALVMPSRVFATHIEPAKASKAQFALVNSFVQCNTPNTIMQASGGGACTPAVPVAGFGGCALSSTGSGKLQLSVAGTPAKGTQVIKVTASAKGLTAPCEGNQLCLVLSWRGTNDDCPEGSCTAPDLEDWDPFGACCTVAGGACKISTTVNAAALDVPDGKNTGLELLGCGLKTPFDLSGEHAISCGLLLH